MGIKNLINKAGAKAADKLAKLSALSPEQLRLSRSKRKNILQINQILVMRNLLAGNWHCVVLKCSAHIWNK